MSRRLTWPDGTIYTITRSSADTDGVLLEMEWQLPAGGWSPQPHIHPHITETYEVLDGELELLINRSWRRLRPGDHASVEAGAVHTSRVGAAPARVRNVHRPARDFEPYIRALCATANARDLGDLNGPRALLYIAMLVDEFPEHSRAARQALHLATGPLATVARSLGLRPLHAPTS
ncbi:cupin domain-containing protein [Solirubrobacter soli]|uniref:cupin domain-containing protein n=1 Tax=Solirubrobacter soli TaxID=363832 RepID=UPI000416C8AA|nr:cupin domain-containing protein [Solirubrobacter soli]